MKRRIISLILSVAMLLPIINVSGNVIKTVAAEPVQLVKAESVNGNSCEMKITFNTPVAFFDNPSLHIFASDPNGKNDIGLYNSIYSCMAINGNMISGKKYASQYNLIFSKNVEQNGIIKITDGKNSEKYVSCVRDVKGTELSASQDKGYAYANYSIKPINQADSKISNEPNIAGNNGRKVIKYNNSKFNNIKYKSNNLPNKEYERYNPNKYAQLLRAEYTGDDSLKITFSEKVIFQTSKPENFIFASDSSSNDGTKVKAETVSSVDGSMKEGASQFDVTFQSPIPKNGKIELVEDTTALKNDNDCYGIGGLAKAVSGKAIGVSQTLTGSKYNTASVNYIFMDVVAPTAPKNVILLAQSENCVTLSWDDSKDNVGVIGYGIYRDGTEVGIARTTVYTDTGFFQEKSAVYTVKAFDGAGNNSEASTGLTVTYKHDSIKGNPVNPTGENPANLNEKNANTKPDGKNMKTSSVDCKVMAEGTADTAAPTVPENLALLAKADSSAYITWDNSTDDTAVTGYKVFRDGNLVGTSSINGYTDKGLSPATTYTYTVKAYDAAGNSSAQSSGLSVTTKINVPSNILVSSADKAITITWDAVAGAKAYDVELDGKVTSNVTQNTLTFSSVSLGGHKIRVRSVGKDASSDWSTVTEFTTLLGTPKNIGHSCSVSKINLNWNMVAFATSYEIDFDGKVIGDISKTNYQITGLAGGSTHNFRVRAKSGKAVSAWSGEFSVTCLTQMNESGEIKDNTTWEASENPYVITGNLTIDEGKTLTIMPGAIVLINPGVTITVKGKISAVGTQTSPIVFTSSDDSSFGGKGVSASSDYWGGIVIERYGNFTGDYVKIKYGYNNGGPYVGSPEYNEGSSIFDYGTLSLTNSEVSNSYKNGIYLSIQDSYTEVQRNWYELIGKPIKDLNTATIKNTTFYSNSAKDIYIREGYYSGGILIDGSTFIDCPDCAIYYHPLSNDNSNFLMISNNIITAQSTSNCICCANNRGTTDLTISNNTLFDNSAVPLNVDLWGDLKKLTIDSNNITSNENYGVNICYTYKSYDLSDIDITNNNIKTMSTDGLYIDFRGSGDIHIVGNTVNTDENDGIYVGYEVFAYNQGESDNRGGKYNLEISGNTVSSLKIAKWDTETFEIKNNTILGTEFPIHMNADSRQSTIFQDLYKDNIFPTGTKKIFTVNGGTLKANLNFSDEYSCLFVGDIVIPTGITLNVEKGATVLFASTAKLEVNGTLNAVGTQTSPILFTPSKDGGYGSKFGEISVSDTGLFTGDYVKIKCNNDDTNGYCTLFVAGNMTLSNSYDNKSVIIKTSGKSTINISNSVLENIETYDNGVDALTISNSTIGTIMLTDNGAASISITNNKMTNISILKYTTQNFNVSGNSISGCSNVYPVYVNLGTTPNTVFTQIFNNNTFTADKNNIFSIGGTMENNFTLPNSFSYVMVNDIVIPANITLTINPGVVIRSSEGLDFMVSGTLNMKGTETEPIVVTSKYDSDFGGSGSGYGGKIYVKNTGKFDGEYLKLSYLKSDNYAIQIYGSGYLLHSELSNCGEIYTETSEDVTIDNDVINNSSIVCVGKDISCTITIENNLINKSGNIEVRDRAKKVNIIGNTINGSIRITNAAFVDADISSNKMYNDNYTYTNNNIPIFIIVGNGTDADSSIIGKIHNNYNNGAKIDFLGLNLDLSCNYTLSNYYKKYFVDQISVEQGATLTIESGITMACGYFAGDWAEYPFFGDLEIKGTLNANGAADGIITFCPKYYVSLAGIDSNIYGRYWEGIKIWKTGSFFGDYLDISRGVYQINDLAFDVPSTMIYVEGNLSLTNSRLHDTNTDFNSNTSSIAFETDIQPTLLFNTFTDEGSNHLAICNRNSAKITIDARYNYWDSIFGPSYGTDNGGAWVGSGVLTDPYLGGEMRCFYFYGVDGVYTPMGSYSKTYDDLSSGGLDFSRTYNSLDDRNGSSFGRGWTFGYEGSVSDYIYKYVDYKGDTESADIPYIKIVKLPDGSSIVFNKKENNYVAQNSHCTLVKNSDGKFVLTTKDQHKYTFNANGWLESITDKNGNKISIDVDSSGKVHKVTDCVGREYVISYNGDGKISQLSDPMGRKVQYIYSNGNLVKVIGPDGKTAESYSYDDKNFLTEIRNSSGHLVQAIAYYHDSDLYKDKVSALTDSKGNKITYSYDVTNKKVTETDSSGRVTIDNYNIDYLITSTIDADGKTTTTEYFNKMGEIKSVTDRNGNKTSYQIDSNGNVTKITNPDGSTKVYTYDSNSNLTSAKDETGKMTYYIYDANGNLIKKIQPLDGTSTYSDGSNENNYAITKYTYYTNDENSKLGYLEKGLLKTVTNPNGETVTYTYDKNGNVITTTDPETGKVTTYTYNPVGWKISETTPSGNVTKYEYDGDGRVVRITVNGSEVTRIVYDDDGKKIQEISPNQYNSSKDGTDTYSDSSAGTRYSYNEHDELQNETNAGNNTSSYTYDIYGDVLTKTQPNGSIYIYEYDVLNRITKVYFKDNANAASVLLAEYSYAILSGGQTQKTEKRYLNGTDAETTVYTYDYANRLLSQTNPDGTLRTIAYNGNGTVNSITYENGAKQYFKYDGLNRVTEKWVSVDAYNYIYTSVSYDKDGNTVSEKTGKNYVSLWNVPSSFAETDYTYYLNNKKKSETDSSGRKTVYYYDDDGYVCKTEEYSDSSNAIVTEYVNNHYGKPVKKTVYIRKGDMSGNDRSDNTQTVLATEYAYDKNGNLISEKTPDGNITTYTYDALDRQTGMSTGGKDEYGNAVQITSSTTYTFDNQKSTVTDANGNVTRYEYNARGLVTKKIDADGGVTAYWYDNLNRVTAMVSPNNYDPSKSMSEMNRTEYAYDSMNRVKAVSQVYFVSSNQWMNYVEKAYLYDKAGNVIKQLDALGYASGTGDTDGKISSGCGTVYTYNLANQLLTVIDPVSKEKGLQFTYEYTYNTSGRKLTETDANGTVTSYGYDDAGNLLSEKVNSYNSNLLTSKTYTYDLLGRVLTETDGNGNVTSYTYNNFGKVASVTYPGDSSELSKTEYHQYDVMGNNVRTWDTAGKEMLYTYDSQGRVLSVTEKNVNGAELIEKAIKYDKNGNKRYETDGNGNVTEYTNDNMNRVISKTAAGHKMTYTYDLNGNLLTTTDWRGNTYTNIYDPLSRLVEKKDPYGKTVEKLTYNIDNSQTTSADALGKVTSYTYDRNNRLLSTTDPAGHVTSQTYDNVGNVKTKTDGDGHVTTYNYDGLNRLISVYNAKNETTSYTYDQNGNVLTFTDGGGDVKIFEYNTRNKMTKSILPGGRTGTAGSYSYVPSKTESYTYDANGNMTSKTDRNGVVTTYVYDVHGRLLSQTTPNASISYIYDANGNILAITDSAGTTSRTYDSQNRVVTKAVPNIGTCAYAYDITEGMDEGCWAETSTDPKGNVTKKIYDRTGRLAKVVADGKVTTYNYYDNGSLKSTVYNDGSSEDYTYTDDGLLASLVNKKSDRTVIDSYTYTYDAAHNMLSKTDAKGMTQYTFDPLNRLLMIGEPSGQTTTYSYDAAGNRAAETVTVGTNTSVSTYTYDSANRLLNVSTKLNGTMSELISYTYDNNGNELTVTKTEYANGTAQTPLKYQTNTYDELSQLIATVTNNGKATGTVTNTYNGEGHRVKKSVGGQTIMFLYEGDKAVLELDGSGNQTAWNVYGLNLISRKVGANTLTYMYNGHADVTALLNANGNVIQTYYYDAFGNILDSVGNADNSITYSGYYYDKETGLYYLNSRMYDPITARFLQEDTYSGEYNDPLSLNLYTYCHNEPLMYSDPTGHFWKELWNSAKDKYNKAETWVSGKVNDVKNAVENTKAYKTIKNEYNKLKSKASQTWNNVKSGAKKEFQKAKAFYYKHEGAITTVSAAALIAAGTAVTVATGGIGTPAGLALTSLGMGMLGSGIAVGATEAVDYMQNGKVDYSFKTYAGVGAGGFAMGALGPVGEALGVGGGAAGVAWGSLSAMTGDAIQQQIISGSINPNEMLMTGATAGILGTLGEGIGKIASSAGSIVNSAKNAASELKAGVGRLVTDKGGYVKLPNLNGESTKADSLLTNNIGVRIDSIDDIVNYGKNLGNNGQLFLTNKEALRGLDLRNNVDLAKAEQILGLQSGRLTNSTSVVLTQVDLNGLNTRLPSSGNELFIPGGLTSGGAKEIVVDSMNIFDNPSVKSIRFFTK